MKKQLILLGHLSLIVTAILALFFFKERVLYVDPGQQLFEMINEENYKVFVGRYSMMINQTFPLIAIKMGLPLTSLMMVYSISFVIVYYLCFLLSVYVFKNIPAGLTIAFAPILIRMMFGHSIAETWLGIGYAGLFYAALNYKDHLNGRISFRKIPYYLLLILLVLVNYYMHPSTLFLLGFAVGFTCVQKNQWLKLWPYFLSVIILVIFSYRFFFTKFVYEENFFNGLRDAPKNIGHLFNSYVFKFFIIHFWNNYVWLLVLLAVGIGWNLIKRTYAQLFFSLGYMILYVMVAALAFFTPYNEMLNEARFLPLIFMTIILLTEVLQKQKRNYAITGGFILILGISYCQLFKTVQQFHTPRIAFYQKLLKETEQYPERKFYSFKEKCWPSKLNSWGTAVETLMLTSMEDKNNSRSIFLFNKSEVIDTNALKDPCMFLWVEWWTYYSENFFNKKYFDLGCTPYRKINNPECDPNY
jgi:hypothetical protein